MIIGSPAELHVVAAVRDHLSWVLSRYLESVTKGFHRETASVDDFIRRHVEEGSFDYAWRLDVITRHLGADRVTVVDYDRAGPTFVAEMLEAMGLAEWFKDAEVVDQRINGSRPIAAATSHCRVKCGGCPHPGSGLPRVVCGFPRSGGG